MCFCSCCPWPGNEAAGTFAWQGRLYARDAPGQPRRGVCVTEQVRVSTSPLAAPGCSSTDPAVSGRAGDAPAAPASGRAELCQLPRSRSPFPWPRSTFPPLPGAARRRGERGPGCRRAEDRQRTESGTDSPRGPGRCPGLAARGRLRPRAARTCSARHRRQAAREPRRSRVL